MKARKVIQYSKSMEELAVFDSIKEAQAQYNCSHVSQVCRGKRATDGGYIWRYLDDVPDKRRFSLI